RRRHAPASAWRGIPWSRVPHIAEFEQLDGVRMADVHGAVLHCQVIGSIDQLLKAVAKNRVRDLVSHGADLEALFLDYYRGEED
ncbi:MAG: hypothetical protein OXH26_06515, partial [bacterium]|nr:hypothetical protein [bacterium]